MTRSTIQSWNEFYQGLLPVKTNGSQLMLFNDCDTLGYSDSRIGALELGQRAGNDSGNLYSA